MLFNQELNNYLSLAIALRLSGIDTIDVKTTKSTDWSSRFAYLKFKFNQKVLIKKFQSKVLIETKKSNGDWRLKTGEA